MVRMARGGRALAAWAVVLIGVGSSAGVPPLRDYLNAPILEEERIEAPTDTAKAQTMLVRQPKTGGYTLLIFFFNYGVPDPVDVRSVDMMTGEVKGFAISTGLNVSLAPARAARAPDGKVYLYLRGLWMYDWPTPPGEIWCFDPVANDLYRCGSPPKEIMGSGYTRLTADTDGKVYGTTTENRRVCLYHYDPAAREFHSYGPVSPVFDRGGETHGYSITVHEGYAYIACGKVPWRLVAVNLKTGESKVVLEAPPGNSQIWVGDDYAIRRPDPNDHSKMEMFLLRNGKATLHDAEWSFAKRNERRKAIQEAEGADEATDYKPEVWTGQLKPDPGGRSVLWYRRKGPTGPGRWRRVVFRVKTFPQSIRRLSAMPDGRLLGTPGSYEGCFIHDPVKGGARWLGRIGLSHYATVMHNGKVYMSGYASAPVYEYDPTRPWTAGRVRFGKRPVRDSDPRSNPRLVTRLEKSWAHKMWDGGVGADGAIYFCGEVGRQGNGGALGWWDPAKQEAGAADYKLFAGQKTLYMYVAERGAKLVMNSHVTINNLTGKVPDSARTFVFDVAKKEVVDVFEPVPGAKMLGPLVEYAPGKVVSVADVKGYRAEERQDILWGLDLASKKVLFRVKLPLRFCVYHTGIRGGQEFQKGPDGHVWAYVGEDNHPEHPTLVRIDPHTQQIKIVGRVERRGPMAFVGNDLYRGCEHKAGWLMMRRLPGIAATAD